MLDSGQSVTSLDGMLHNQLLFGPYRTPRFRIGQRVEDERRGTVRIVGLTDGRGFRGPSALDPADARWCSIAAWLVR